MIVKMKFLSISGPRDDIDRVCDVYLSKYEMQIENAATELRTTNNLRPFVEVNPYKESLAKAEQFVGLLPKNKEYQVDRTMEPEAMMDLVRDINTKYTALKEQEDLLKKKKEDLREKEKAIAPFQGIDVDVHKAVQYKYMQVRFGRITHDYFLRLEKYLYHDINALFLESTRDDTYIYGCYFVANADVGKADSMFNSMHFERLDIPTEYIGTPDEAFHYVQDDEDSTDKEIKDAQTKMTELLESHAPQLLGAKKRLDELSRNFDVRRLAARVENGEDDHYILCGWMGEEDVKNLLRDTEHDDKVMIVVEEARDKFFGDAPTKLNNPKIFKPFQLFIDMYGLPAPDEMDPTIFVALTYTMIFGAMFGDVGQGLCLFVFGGLLYLIKKIDLAGIVSVAGIFSTIFGFLYGSVFGFEDLIEPLWLRPTEAMTQLPFFGQLNTVFVVAVAFGMGMNILVMIFQIINSIKAKDKGNLLFSHNGIAGLVFYGMIVLTVVLYMTGHKTPANILLIIFLGIPVLLFLFKEPLTNIVERNHKKMEGGKVMFFVQGFFELFEIMLSYFSNTISYVRIGAFAVSHAAMMSVVIMLAGAEGGIASNTNWIAVVLGNLLVSGMEGLVVAIQVLRLEYYEFFSRFYKGTGREFKPYKEIKK